MGVGYILINQTRKEAVFFKHIGASKKEELAGCPDSAAITTWYMLEHLGDEISFVSDTHDDWPFTTGSRSDFAKCRDVTDEVVTSLINANILKDEGREVFYQDEPEVYVRRLRNIWKS